MASRDRTMMLGVLAVGAIGIAWAASRKRAPYEPPSEPPPNVPPPELPPSTTYEPPSEPPPSAAPDPALPPIEPSAPEPPAKLPRPFGDDPLDVEAGPSNFQPPVEPPPSLPLQPVTLPPSSAPDPALPPIVLQPVTLPPAAKPAAPAAKPPAAKPPAAKPPTAADPIPPPSNAKRLPTQAALDLLEYVKPVLAAKRGSELGTKGKPNAVVKAAQLDMGGVTADGIYGPSTRARGKALINVVFPVRA